LVPFSYFHTAAATAFPLVSLSLASYAHEPVEVKPVAVENIVVKGQAMRDAAAAFSNQRFTEEEVRERNVSQVQELFRYVPGMEVRGFKLGGVADAFVLRGFSSGGHGGDVGIAIDGVPLNEAMSHADGYADLNVIIPLEMGEISILRGPVSAQYGNFNRGGLMLMESRKGGNYSQMDMRVGSFKTADLQLAAGKNLGEKGSDGSLNLAAQIYHTDGYRPQSEFDRSTISGRYATHITPNIELAVSGRFHRGRWNSASYVTQAEFDDDRKAFDKNPNVQNDGGDKSFSTLRLDVNTKINPNLKLLAFAYGTKQDFTRYFTRPVSLVTWRQREETYDRDVFGTGVNLNGRATIGAMPVSFVTGVEVLRESTDFQFYDGLNQRVRTGSSLIANRRSLRR
jgi:iron complex outermembrane recepter protein